MSDTDPESIVRALAARTPANNFDRNGDRVCALCRETYPDEDKDSHEPDCPWRLAVEWVAAVDVTPPSTPTDTA